MRGDGLTELAWMATRCLCAAEFRSQAVDWVAHHVGVDAANLVRLDEGRAVVTHTLALDAPWIDRFNQNIDRYRADLQSLVAGGLAMGGASFGEWSRLEKWAALPGREGFEEGMAFPIGIRIGSVVPMTIRGTPSGVLFLGRGGRRSIFTQEEAELLARAAPVLSLGEALHQRPAVVAPAAGTGPRRSERGALSPRERSIVEYVVLGLTNRQIALALGTAPLTVRNQLGAIFRKLSVGSRTELAAVALREGLVDAPSGTGE